MVDSEDIPTHRICAKRRNEATKLSATLLNNLGVGIFVAGLIAPSVAGRTLPAAWYVALLCIAFGLHMAGRALLRGLVSED